MEIAADATNRLLHLNLVDLNSEQFVCEVIIGIKFIAVFDIFTLQSNMIDTHTTQCQMSISLLTKNCHNNA